MKTMKIFVAIAVAFPALATEDAANPVSRVVGLLKDLKARVEADGKSEQAAYDRFACWCEQTTKKTAADIGGLKGALKTSGNSILKSKGSVAALATNINGLSNDIKANEKEQGSLTSIREKENGAFMAEKAETESALAGLESALTILNTAQGSSFLQTSVWATTLSEVISKMSRVTSSVQSNDKQLALLDQLSNLRSSASYSPQSATITGILSEMYSTFSKNLQIAIADEAKAQRNYEDLMSTKASQLATDQGSIVKDEEKKTEGALNLADSTATFSNSEEELEADTAFFDTTVKTCEQKTKDWSVRSLLRKQELAGIDKAIAILTSGSSRALFAKKYSKSGQTSFMQLSSESRFSSSAQEALHGLEARARDTHSYRLAALAARVRMQASTGGAFDSVVDSITQLMMQLDVEEQADIKKVDECKEQYQKGNLKKDDLNWKIENNDAKIQKHDKLLADKKDAKALTIKGINDADKELVDIKTKRKAENSVFLQTKKDDEMAIDLIGKAKVALTVYESKSLLQALPTGQPEFKISDSQNSKGQRNGVVAMMDKITEDIKNDIADATVAEAAAQKDYEDMKSALEEQQAKLKKAKVSLQAQIAEETSAKAAETNLKKENTKSLANVKKTEADLKKTCDDAIKLQPERRKKREIEMDGLREAKDLLEGMAPSALLQKPQRALESHEFPTFQGFSFLQRRLAN